MELRERGPRNSRSSSTSARAQGGQGAAPARMRAARESPPTVTDNWSSRPRTRSARSRAAAVRRDPAGGATPSACSRSRPSCRARSTARPRSATSGSRAPIARPQARAHSAIRCSRGSRSSGANSRPKASRYGSGMSSTRNALDATRNVPGQSVRVRCDSAGRPRDRTGPRGSHYATHDRVGPSRKPGIAPQRRRRRHDSPSSGPCVSAMRCERAQMATLERCPVAGQPPSPKTPLLSPLRA